MSSLLQRRNLVHTDNHHNIKKMPFNTARTLSMLKTYPPVLRDISRAVEQFCKNTLFDSFLFIAMTLLVRRQEPQLARENVPLGNPQPSVKIGWLYKNKN